MLLRRKSGHRLKSCSLAKCYGDMLQSRPSRPPTATAKLLPYKGPTASGHRDLVEKMTGLSKIRCEYSVRVMA